MYLVSPRDDSPPSCRRLVNDGKERRWGCSRSDVEPPTWSRWTSGTGDEEAAADIIIDLARTEPVPVVSRERAPAPGPHASTGRYDPTEPGQTPVSGVDLVTFAVLSRRLHERPAHAHPKLLASYGHTTHQLERREDRVDGPDGPAAAPLRRLRDRLPLGLSRLPLGLSRQRWR